MKKSLLATSYPLLYAPDMSTHPYRKDIVNQNEYGIRNAGAVAHPVISRVSE